MWKYALKEVNKHKIISQGNYFEVLKQDDMRETGVGNYLSEAAVREVLNERLLTWNLNNKKKPAAQKSGKSIPTGKRACVMNDSMVQNDWMRRKKGTEE